MNKKKAINKDPFKLFAAESELTQKTWAIAWGIDAMDVETSFSVNIHSDGELAFDGLPKHIEKGKPSPGAMLMAREIQAMRGAVTGGYKVSKGSNGQLHFVKKFHGYRG